MPGQLGDRLAIGVVDRLAGVERPYVERGEHQLHRAEDVDAVPQLAVLAARSITDRTAANRCFRNSIRVVSVKAARPSTTIDRIRLRLSSVLT